MTSTTPLSNPTALLQGIRSLVAFLAEAQICETWADVRAAESANVDCAIHIDPSQLTGNSTERLMSLLGSSGRAETIIPVDVKTATPIACHDHAYWKIALQRIQLRHCEVVIVVFPKEPDCVVVLPVHYLRKKTGSNLDGLESRQFYTHGFRPLWMLHPLPPIPPELTPCVVPVSGLERALADIRRCGKDSTQWSNDYTGAVFTSVPPPRFHDASVLKPAFPMAGRAFDQVKGLFSAFAAHSNKFRIELARVRPLLGDFKIVSSASYGLEPPVESSRSSSGEVAIFVEAKVLHCKTVRDDQTNQLHLLHAQSSMCYTERPIFTWKAQWDYIYTTLGSGSEQALFIPRDKIPKAWWNAAVAENQVVTAEDEVWLHWYSEDWKAYLVDTLADDRLVRDVERILDNNRWKAQDRVPLDTIAPEALIETNTRAVAKDAKGDTQDDSKRRQEFWSSAGFDRGFGSYAHKVLRGETYQIWAAENLIRLSRANGKAAILDAGRQNPINRFFLARYLWSPADKSRYDLNGDPPRAWQFPKQTPVIPITFLRVNGDTDQFDLLCTNNTAYMSAHLPERPPSIVIVDLFPPSCIRLPHCRFVIASDELPTVLTKHKRFQLKTGLLEQNQVDENQVLDKVLGLFQGTSHTQTLGRSARVIDMLDYCHNLESVWKAGSASIEDAILTQAPQGDI